MPYSAYAQLQLKLQFTSIAEQNGLKNKIITNLAQDGNGFIWAGCATGLMRYDGYKFTYLTNSDDSLGLKGNCVIDLQADNYGNLWIINENGVFKYDCLSEQFSQYRYADNGQQQTSPNPSKIFCCHNGDIRFFVDKGLILQLDSNSHTLQDITYKYAHNSTIKQCEYCGNNEFMLLLGEAQIPTRMDMDGNILTQYTYDCNSDGTTIQSILSILNNNDGTMYIGGYTGLFLADNRTATIRHISKIGNTNMPKEVTGLHRDRSGKIWIATNAEELYILDAIVNKAEPILSDPKQNSKTKLNSSSIMDILEDRRGLIWLATWHGIAVTDPTSEQIFKCITAQANNLILNQNIISSIEERSDSVLMIASDGGGITFWNPGDEYSTDTWNAQDLRGLRNPSVLTIKTDSKGRIYTGGYNHGLNVTDSDYSHTDQYAANPNDENSLESDFVRSIMVENDTAVWVLTNGAGLHLFNPETKKFRRIRSDKDGNTPLSPYGICLEQAPSGEILFGTYNGLVVYNQKNNSIRNYNAADNGTKTLSHNWVYCIYADSQNNIWVGTASGLNLFDMESGEFTVFSSRNGLANACCYSIEEDDNNHLWISTSSGIQKFSTKTFEVERTYSVNDGIVSNNFYVNGSLKAKDGTMYFANTDGLVIFDPQKIVQKSAVPAPTIMSLLINYKHILPGVKNSPLSKSITQTSEITINHYQNNFAVEFASLGYINCNSYTYYYRLSENNNDNGYWLNIGKRREIDFTSIAPGTYHLQICAQNSDGVWSDTSSLKITVLPPWYATTTIRILMALLIILAAFVAYRLRVKRLKTQRELLKAEVKSRTEEITVMNEELEASLQHLRSKTIALEGSIHYAQTIQQALLTKNSDFNKHFDTAIVYYPKDIVSGDFFWLKVYKGMIFASVIDCTGHGVPGAFMSLIANSALNDIIDVDKVYEPANILELLSQRISQMLEQDTSQNKDGMDMALCRFDYDYDNNNIAKMTYSGAKNPVYLHASGNADYEILTADRFSIAGGVRSNQDAQQKLFTQQERILHKGDIVYMFSDGITDHSNPQRRRFGKKRLFDLLESIHGQNMEDQAQSISEAIEKYADGIEQRDDISILGLRIR